MPAPEANSQSKARPVSRVAAGFVLAMAIALSVFVLMTATSSGSIWFGSVWFLGLLPAVLCAVICYVGDADLQRSRAFYWQVPVALAGLVCAASVFILREGVICLVMLSPIWLGSGWIGAFVMRSQRHRRGRAVESSFLIIPLLAGVMEAQIPLPHETVSVSRTVVIEASAHQIWPHAVSSRDISDDEGRWTVTHNLIGMPRPRDSITIGQGVGAVRTAYWGRSVNFEERLVTWEPGSRLGWDFRFTNTSVQDNTDRHIAPDGQFLTVDSGEYVLRPLTPTRTELTLTTRYIAKTHVNPYARLWGELMMGDIEQNVLTIIKDRAEAHSRVA